MCQKIINAIEVRGKEKSETQYRKFGALWSYMDMHWGIINYYKNIARHTNAVKQEVRRGNNSMEISKNSKYESYNINFKNYIPSILTKLDFHQTICVN